MCTSSLSIDPPEIYSSDGHTPLPRPTVQADEKPAEKKAPAADAEKKEKRKPRKPKKDRPKPTKPKDKATSLTHAGIKKKKVRKPKKQNGKHGSGGGGKEEPNMAKSGAGAGAGAGGDSKWKHGDWACAKCGAHNFRGKDSCFRCKYARANSVKAASPESALEYLTKRQGGSKEMDSVQHLWIGKSVYNRDINDATFDLYVPYVKSLDNKHKLQVLNRAKLAVARATRLVEALKDTPEESAEEAGEKRSKKRRKHKKDKKGDKSEAGKSEQGEKSKSKENQKKETPKKDTPEKEDAAAKKKEAASPSKPKRKAAAEPEPSPMRVTRSRAAKK